VTPTDKDVCTSKPHSLLEILGEERAPSSWNLSTTGGPAAAAVLTGAARAAVNSVATTRAPRSGCEPEDDRAATQGTLDASARERMIWAEMTAA
jgi:hypothetical protein